MRYQLEGFVLDSGTRQLLRGDVEVHLSPKAFELLVLLVDSASRAMSKAELHQKLWPDTFVQETNLATLVAEIRRALGDAAERPRYVRTVHRFGYWFIGQVRSAPSRGEAVKPPVQYWLVWDKRQIAVCEGENVLGRAPDSAVWIEAPGVSRYHACIRLAGTAATLEDLGSKNGTYVRGRLVTTPVALNDGDQIRLGSVLITFRTPAPAGTTDTVRA